MVKLIVLGLILLITYFLILVLNWFNISYFNDLLLSLEVCEVVVIILCICDYWRL